MAEKRNLQNINGTATGTSSEALAYNSKREYLMVQNRDSTNNLYLTFGDTATVANGIQLLPGEKFAPPYEVVSSVNLITAGTSVNYVIVTSV